MLTRIPVPVLAGLALLATIGTALAQGDGCIKRNTTAGAQSTPATTTTAPAPASDARQS
ncbi:hypothetical protein [Inquilinus sp. Marseille-Q2685]|uniref:hypothetical protein n=1 Tax=Inquilinus sp. Marseille-Q2685 TaxID=2866581 RepID=UPI001CE3F7EB|nr:hypothetical protein [Inquilinus sp. Marseille-Q2685]